MALATVQNQSKEVGQERGTKKEYLKQKFGTTGWGTLAGIAPKETPPQPQPSPEPNTLQKAVYKAVVNGVRFKFLKADFSSVSSSRNSGINIPANKTTKNHHDS